MLSVYHQITLGSTTYTPNDQPRLIGLQITASLAAPVNLCRLVLGHPDGLSLVPSQPVVVKLGYENNLALVFTGMVGSVEWRIARVTIYAVGSFQSLTSARFNLLYEKPSAGDIVKDIAQSRLKLKIDNVENGLKFPVYAVGDRIPAYDHLATLAQQCGFDFYANLEDKVVFAKYKAANTHELIYGNNILSVTLDQPAPGVTGVEIYGESPSSQGQGEQAYAWLTKKEVKGTAGSRSGVLLRFDDPTARTQDVASKIAQALLDHKQQKRRGQIRVLGDASIGLGDGINVTKLPLSPLNGTFKIKGVTHYLNRQQGFYTLVNWEET